MDGQTETASHRLGRLTRAERGAAVHSRDLLARQALGQRHRLSAADLVEGTAALDATGDVPAGAPMTDEDDSEHGAAFYGAECFALSEHSAYVVSGGEGNRTGTKLDRRLRNLAGNPAASLAGDHYDDDWDRVAWVRVDGPAEIFTSGDEHADAVRLLRERYPQFDDRPLEGAPMIALRIERILSFGPLDVSG